MTAPIIIARTRHINLDGTPAKVRTLKTAPAEPKKYWTAAECAAAIRAELKAAFPQVKFSVRKSSADSVRVEWTDGPERAAVERIVRKYERGTFDGMFDIYNYDNRRDDIPQVQYVNTYREMSDRTRNAIAAELAPIWGVRAITFGECGAIEPEYIDGRRTYDRIHGAFGMLRLLPDAADAAICPQCFTCGESGDRYCGECGGKLPRRKAGR